MYQPDMRIRSTLLLLNQLRNINPRMHTQFMEQLWQCIFIEGSKVTSVDDYIKVGSFSICHSFFRSFVKWAFRIQKCQTLFSRSKIVKMCWKWTIYQISLLMTE